MPFAGELLQVRDDERDWEGAAERLLRGFGLALLVPDAHTTRRSPTGVDGNHLRGRLVYFHVRPPRAGELPGCTRTLVRKLAIKPTAALRLARARARPPLRRRLLRHRRAVPPRDAP